MYEATRSKGFGAEVTRRILLGTYVLSHGYYDAYYGQAQKVRALIRRDFDDVFTKVDLVAAPATPSTAFRIGAHSNNPLEMYLEDVFTLPANLAGVPGLSLCAGFDGQGLPIGLQMLGPHFSDERLLTVAKAYQAATDWHQREPQL